MGAAHTIPPARKATEAELVSDIAETVDLHSYKVIQHKITVDHEKEETRLVVTMLKGNPDQGKLKLEKGGQDVPGDGED